MSLVINRKQDWKFCIAPMLGVTDRHCRFLYSLFSSNARLYSEMVVTSSLMNNEKNIRKFLYFDQIKNPVVLQLGGNNPNELARSSILGEKFGYSEININCGCPSNKVLNGSFGACLMNNPFLVADCVKSIIDKVSIPVSIKHRLGIDQNSSYSFVRDFVGILYEAGCRIFIVHARNALLGKLSPKHNRIVPPLNYEYVYKLKGDFPNAVIVLNGGINDLNSIEQSLNKVDGIMIGRSIMNDPLFAREVTSFLYPNNNYYSLGKIINLMFSYAEIEVSRGVPLWIIVKPMLNMFKGFKGAKLWRKTISNQQELKKNNPELILKAWNNISESLVM